MEKIPSRKEIAQLLREPSSYAHFSRDDLFHVVKNTLYSPSESNHQHLTIVGTHHIADPKHWYYDHQHIPRIFLKWEEATRQAKDGRFGPTNRIMIAEGLPDAYGYVERHDTLFNRISPDFDTTVQEYWSEIGLQCAASDIFDIPLISGEPAHFSEFAHLIQMFPDRVQEIIDYYILREGPLFNRRGENKLTLETFMGTRIDLLEQHLSKVALQQALPSLSMDYQQFTKRFNRYFDRPFNPKDEACNTFLLRVTSAELEDESFAS